MKHIKYIILLLIIVINNNIIGQLNVIKNDSNCILDRKNLYGDIDTYEGECKNDKPNGWGTFKYPNGNKITGLFVDNKIQDNIIEFYVNKHKTLYIGTNKGFDLHGPAIGITDDLIVNYGNWDNGYPTGGADNYFLITKPEFLKNEKLCVNELPDEKSLIPNLKHCIIIRKKEDDVKRQEKYWISLIDMVKNKTIFNFGSAENPIISNPYSNLSNNLSFKGYSSDTLNAIFEINNYSKNIKQYLICNLKTGLFTKSLVLNNIKLLNSTEGSSEILNKLLLKSNFNYYKAFPYKIVQLKDQNYVAILNNNEYANSSSYNPIYGSNSMIIKFNNKLEVMNTIEFKKSNICDFAVNEISNQLAISLKGKDSTFFNVYNLDDFKKKYNVFQKGVIFPGKQISFSQSGTYLTHTSNNVNTTIFYNNKLYFGIHGIVYGFNSGENSIIVNDNGVLRAYDLAKKRLIWSETIGDDYVNTKFNVIDNNFVLFSSNMVLDKLGSRSKNGHKIMIFKIPEAEDSYKEFIINLEFSRKKELYIQSNKTSFDSKTSTINSNNISTNTATSSTSTTNSTCSLKFYDPQLKITFEDNRLNCCCCNAHYARYHIDNEAIQTKKIEYLILQLVFHAKDNNFDAEHMTNDIQRLSEFISKQYSPFLALTITSSAIMYYQIVNSMPYFPRPSKNVKVKKYIIDSKYCSLRCENDYRCNCN